jgi:hypothetical protein
MSRSEIAQSRRTQPCPFRPVYWSAYCETWKYFTSRATRASPTSYMNHIPCRLANGTFSDSWYSSPVAIFRQQKAGDPVFSGHFWLDFKSRIKSYFIVRNYDLALHTMNVLLLNNFQHDEVGNELSFFRLWGINTSSFKYKIVITVITINVLEMRLLRGLTYKVTYGSQEIFPN